ncbi:hypothetical protein pb186bvf_009387 [Paramecium bursaria]
MYSKLEQFFKNYPSSTKRIQNEQLTFRIEKKKCLPNKDYFNVVISDTTYFLDVIFTKLAATKLELQEKVETRDIERIEQYKIQVNEWQLFNMNQNKVRVVILDFEFIELDATSYIDLCQFSLPNFKEETKQRIQLKIRQDLSNQIEQGNFLQKKVKLEFQESTLINTSFRSTLNDTLAKKSVEQEFTQINVLYKGIKKWILRGRILNKSVKSECKRTGSNPGPEREYFKIFIIDKDSDIIQGYFYDNACRKYYTELQEGKVYSFTNAQVKQLPQNNGLKHIQFDEYSLIKDDVPQNVQSEIPTYPQINYLTIQKIHQVEPNEQVDLIGIVYEESQLTELQGQRKSFLIFDNTGKIYVNFWGQYYEHLKFEQGQVVAIKSLKVSCYNNQVSLNSNAFTTIVVPNPSYQQCLMLDIWKSKRNLSELIKPQEDTLTFTIKQVQEYVEDLISNGRHKQAYPKQIVAHIMAINNRNVIYAGCPTNRCFKKMIIDEKRAVYQCQSCQTESNHPRYRFILKVKLVDDTSSMEASIFDENSSKLLGMTANEFKQLSDEQQLEVLQICKEKSIRISISFKEFSGLLSPTFTIQSIEDVDYKRQMQQDIDFINEIEELAELEKLI